MSNLENTVSELLTAVIDLQNRVSTLDQRPLKWPADTYERRHAPPFEPGS